MFEADWRASLQSCATHNQKEATSLSEGRIPGPTASTRIFSCTKMGRNTKRPIRLGPQRHFPAFIMANPAAAALLHFAHSRCRRKTISPHTPAQGPVQWRLAVKSQYG